jgi:hypothetical protein
VGFDSCNDRTGFPGFVAGLDVDIATGKKSPLSLDDEQGESKLNMLSL